MLTATWLAYGLLIVLAISLIIAAPYIPKKKHQPIYSSLGTAVFATALVLLTLNLQDINEAKKLRENALRDLRLIQIDLKDPISDFREIEKTSKLIFSVCEKGQDPAAQLKVLSVYMQKTPRDFGTVVRDHNGILFRATPATASVMRTAANTYLASWNTVRISYDTLLEPLIRIENRQLFRPADADLRRLYICEIFHYLTKSGLTDFLYQRDGEIITFARPDPAVVAGTGSSSVVRAVDIRAMSAV